MRARVAALGDGVLTEAEKREKILAAIANEPQSLYQVMRATGIGGWEAGEILKQFEREGKAIRTVDSATCWRAS